MKLISAYLGEGFSLACFWAFGYALGKGASGYNDLGFWGHKDCFGQFFVLMLWVEGLRAWFGLVFGLLAMPWVKGPRI